MKQAKQAFEQRCNEIGTLYNGLFTRQREISEEIRILSNQISQEESESIVEDFLRGADQGVTHKLKSKVDELRKEYSTIEKKIIAIHSKGGLTGLYMSDKQLHDLIKPLSKELAAQAKEDEKKRVSLEKRYQKVIDEILKLNEERLEFERLSTEVRGILTKLNKATNDISISSDIRPSYKSDMWHYYRHLGKVKNFSPDKYQSI